MVRTLLSLPKFQEQLIPTEQIRETVKETWKEHHYLLDPHGACGYRALVEGLKEGETGVFLETAHSGQVP